MDGEEATEMMKRTLEADPPMNAKVSFEADQAASGWNAPAVAPWLHDPCWHQRSDCIAKNIGNCSDIRSKVAGVSFEPNSRQFSWSVENNRVRARSNALPHKR